MKKFALGLILSLVLSIFAFNVGYAESVKESSCYLRDISKDIVIQDLKNYVLAKDYFYSSLDKDKDKSLFKVKAGCSFPSCYFDVQVAEYKNEVKVITYIKPGIFGFSRGEKAAENYVKLLKQKYPLNLINTYKTKEERQVIINQKKEEALKDRIFKIDTRNYPKIDPEFAENKELIKKGVHDNGHKRIDYLSSSSKYYEVTNDNLILGYNADGNLKRIGIVNGEKFPKIVYGYNYPDGNLIWFNIKLSNFEQESFNSNGEVPDFAIYMKLLQKKIKSNWKPSQKTKNYSIVVLFSIDRDGKLESPYIKASNGTFVDEQDALAAIKNSAPFEPLPVFYGEDHVDVRFTFDLNAFSD